MSDSPDPLETFFAWLQERPDLQARPGFKEGLWARLVARIGRESEVPKR